MPRIPIYQRQVSPSGPGAPANLQAGRVFSGSGQGFDSVAAGLDKLAAGIDRSEQVDFALEKDRIENEGRIWAAKATSQADLDMAEHLKKSQESAPPGAAGFTPSFLKGFDEYAEKAAANAPSQFARQLLQSHAARSREAYGKAAMMWESHEGLRYEGQQIDEGVNMSASLVSANPAWFEREMGKWGATIDGLKRDPGIKAKLRDVAKTMLVGASVKGWIDKNPQQAAEILDNWMSDTSEKKGVYFNAQLNGGETVRVPIGMADFKQQQSLLEYARQKADGVRQEVAVSLRYDTQNMEALAQAGVAPTGPMRTEAEFRAAFKNPEVAAHEWARYQTARSTAQATSSLAGKSTAELLQVMQTKPNPSDPNAAVTAHGINVQAQAAADILRQRDADPVGYAIARGDFGLKPLDMAKPDAFAEELKRRTAAIAPMAEKYGKPGVLSKPEATALAGQLAILPADQKVAQLETIRKSVGDDMVYSALLNSIRPDSPVTAMVGNIAVAGAKENARMIAIGEDLLNPSKSSKGADGGKGAGFPMPKEGDLRSKFVEYVGDAYRGYPDAEAAAYQAFRAYYAAASSRKGGADPAAGVDATIAKAAVKAATGGVTSWKTDMFGNSTPSANVVLPYGMPEDKFRDRVAKEWNAVKGVQGYSKTDVGDIGLYNTGANGEYMVMSGSSWLPGKDGKPIILRVK